MILITPSHNCRFLLKTIASFSSSSSMAENTKASAEYAKISKTYAASEAAYASTSRIGAFFSASSMTTAGALLLLPCTAATAGICGVAVGSMCALHSTIQPSGFLSRMSFSFMAPFLADAADVEKAYFDSKKKFEVLRMEERKRKTRDDEPSATPSGGKKRRSSKG